MAQPPVAGRSILWKAHSLFFYLGIVYAVVIVLLAIPPIQRHAAYQHSLRFPLFANFSLPEKYGLAPGKTLNLQLTTADNETLGAWFILSESAYHRLASDAFSESRTHSSIYYALKTSPTILFLHGAAATRAVPWRIGAYGAFTSRLSCNVLAIDYRGFAESTGIPSEDGLEEDAYTGWRWLLDRGADAKDVLIVGHSLGTGVAGRLVKRLAADVNEAKPLGVVLLAPFTSLAKLVETYPIFGLPVLQPLQMFPLGIKLMKRLLKAEFDTLSTISNFHIPTLIAHAQDDDKIPHSHSITLLDELLTPLLPPVPSLPSAPGSPFLSEDFAAFTKANEHRHTVRSTLVTKREIPGFGVVEEFDRDGPDGNGDHKVVYVETFWGSHVKIGVQEGVQEEIARAFKLGPFRKQS